MQRSDSQRRPFDSILKRGLDVRRESGGDSCPDEATLAAYCDRALPAAQGANWEEHFSNCARCQGMLAALARARSPGETASVRTAGRRWELYAGALAAALVGISVAAGLIYQARHQSFEAIHALTQSSELARNQGQPKAEPGPQIALNENANQEAATSQSAPAAPPPTAKELSPPSLARSAPSRDIMLRRGAGLGLAGGSAPQPAPAERFAAGSAGNAPALAERESMPAPPAGAGIGGRLAPPPNLLTAPAAAPMISSGAALAMRSVRTADNVERWRLGANGMIQHLAPDGSWQEQASGVTAALRAGSAPSPSTCWIVGSGGTILRTTDGEHWQTINSPTATDLVAVNAIDASEATVTAAGGNRFATSDGGRTWRPL